MVLASVSIVLIASWPSSSSSFIIILFFNFKCNITYIEICLGVLIIFAVIASLAVLREGLADENRNKFRLALHCIMILTSVVPPELPMELSLAGVL